MALFQAAHHARASGAAMLSLPMVAAAFASAPSVATAVLDHDALLRDLGAQPASEVDFGTMPGGFFGIPLDERAKNAFAALERDVASAAAESVRPSRVLLAFAAVDAELRAILDRNDLTEDVLRALSS
ncbi:MAG TPA: hypothetical protein VJ276_22890 [Thermoanaerobaculia bacterium]|nr:hypothetical protein [Thermoanaerobaculia bacterium]